MADSLMIEEAPPFGGDDLASSVIVEPPPVVADGVAASVGTLPAAAIQFADLTESGSESGDDETNSSEQQQQQLQQLESSSSNGGAGNNTPAARSSPPPNCAICLSRCRRKCFTDSCMHQFCFKCLCEWSKIKPECPLCKQPFKTIIHNVRTLDDFDRYTVESAPPEHSALSFHIFNIRRQRYMLQNQSVMTDNADESQDEAAGGGQHLRIPALYYRSEPFRMELLNYYRNEPEQRGSWSLNQLWRRYVYDRKLYALPVMDTMTGNFREWSARFYRDNPSQMHRLMPWINRDVVCLLRNAPQFVSDVMRLMHEILPMINIPTRQFRRRLSPFLGERTNHFIHELFNFARSPFDMIGYDRVVQYTTHVAEVVELNLLDRGTINEAGMSHEPNASSNSANASGNSGTGTGGDGGSGNNGNASPDDPITSLDRLPRPMTSVIVTNPSATHSFSVTMNSDGSELPGISIRRTTTSNVGSQTVAINLSMRRPANEVIEIDDGDAAANAEVAAINDTNNQAGRRQAVANLPISAHIELQSSDCSNTSDDDDECVFVLERKPPHLRTPELVSLDSNSDSDVVFVDEQKATPPPKAAGSSADSNASHEPPPEATGNEQLFMGASTSTGVLSTSGKNWKMVLEDARRQGLMRTRSGRSKRAVTRNQQQQQQRNQQPQDASASGSGISTSWSTTSDSSSSDSDDGSRARSKKRATRKRRSRKRPAKTKLPAQYKSKRRKQEQSETEADEEEEENKPRQDALEPRVSSSDSSSMSSCEDDSSDSSAATGNNNNADNNDNSKSNSSSSNNSSDDDSTENLMLSALRATLKAEHDQHEDTKPPKRELPDLDDDNDATIGEGEDELSLHQQQQQEEEEQQQQQYNMPKRRLSCNSSSSSNLSSHNNSNSVPSTLASHCTTMSSCSALGMFNTNTNGNVVEPPSTSTSTQPLSMVHDIANSLIELSTLSVGAAGASDGGLFNEQSQGVDDSMGFLQNTLPSTSSLNTHDDDAQLGLYSDASNELQHYQRSVKRVLDVVGDSQEETAEADEDNQHDELVEEEHEHEDEIDVEEEEDVEQEHEREHDLGHEEPQQELEQEVAEEVHGRDELDEEEAQEPEQEHEHEHEEADGEHEEANDDEDDYDDDDEEEEDNDVAADSDASDSDRDAALSPYYPA